MREKIEENKWMEERPDENKDVLAMLKGSQSSASSLYTHIYLKKKKKKKTKKKEMASL